MWNGLCCRWIIFSFHKILKWYLLFLVYILPSVTQLYHLWYWYFFIFLFTCILLVYKVFPSLHLFNELLYLIHTHKSVFRIGESYQQMVGDKIMVMLRQLFCVCGHVPCKIHIYPYKYGVISFWSEIQLCQFSSWPFDSISIIPLPLLTCYVYN